MQLHPMEISSRESKEPNRLPVLPVRSIVMDCECATSAKSSARATGIFTTYRSIAFTVYLLLQKRGGEVEVDNIKK